MTETFVPRREEGRGPLVVLAATTALAAVSERAQSVR